MTIMVLRYALGWQYISGFA